MKRSIILLVVLIVLFAMPLMAKPMVMVTNPSFDENNLPNLNECDEQELIMVEGDHVIYDSTESDDHVIYIINFGGPAGYVYVYNDGSAYFVGIYDYDTGKMVNIYIPNFRPTNLDQYIKKI